MRRNDKKKKVLLAASVASMIDLFNRENIRILQESGCHVEVAANFCFGNITDAQRVEQFRFQLQQMGVTVWNVPIPRKAADPVNILRSYQMLKKLCKKKDYDLIHTQSPIGGAVVRLAAAPYRNKGCRVIYTAHGFHFYKGASVFRWLCCYPVEKLLSSCTDTLITINAEDYHLAKSFHAGQVCYIPGIGISLAEYGRDRTTRQKMRREFGFGEQDFVKRENGGCYGRK